MTFSNQGLITNMPLISFTQPSTFSFFCSEPESIFPRFCSNDLHLSVHPYALRALRVGHV